MDKMMPDVAVCIRRWEKAVDDAWECACLQEQLMGIGPRQDLLA
jgi:hypothetical protein